MKINTLIYTLMQKNINRKKKSQIKFTNGVEQIKLIFRPNSTTPLNIAKQIDAPPLSPCI